MTWITSLVIILEIPVILDADGMGIKGLTVPFVALTIEFLILTFKKIMDPVITASFTLSVICLFAWSDRGIWVMGPLIWLFKDVVMNFSEGLWHVVYSILIIGSVTFIGILYTHDAWALGLMGISTAIVIKYCMSDDDKKKPPTTGEFKISMNNSWRLPTGVDSIY